MGRKYKATSINDEPRRHCKKGGNDKLKEQQNLKEKKRSILLFSYTAGESDKTFI